MTIFERALALVRAGDVVGLGSGHAATSPASKEMARCSGILIVSLAERLPLALLLGDNHFNLFAERQRKTP